MTTRIATFTEGTLHHAAHRLGVAGTFLRLGMLRAFDGERCLRIDIPSARKVLAVSYAGEGRYVATLTDDETVPCAADLIRAQALRDHRARVNADILDRETDDGGEW